MYEHHCRICRKDAEMTGYIRLKNVGPSKKFLHDYKVCFDCLDSALSWLVKHGSVEDE